MQKEINILVEPKPYHANTEINIEEGEDIITRYFIMPTPEEHGGAIIRNIKNCIIKVLVNIPIRYYAILSGDEIMYNKKWIDIINGGLIDIRKYIFAAVDIEISKKKEYLSL